jgi:hypothetical protein
MDAAELFENGVVEYQPAAPLERETGDPQVSYDNVRRLMADGWQIKSIRIRPTGVYFALFKEGDTAAHYAPGLHVGHNDLATELVARLAAEAGYGQFEDLLDKYRCVILRDRVGGLEDEEPDEGFDFDDLQAPSESP